MAGPIASAVVLPEELSAPASPTNSLKRRQSSVSEEHAKRPRLDGENDATAEQTQSPDATKPPVRRERGRERRLFGAVLGALSQNPTSAAQKRRSEIEKRQFAQRKREDEESEQKKVERIAKRKIQRWKEQKRFEKTSLRVRHANLLNMAHYLQTETEPHLYYKPWETSPDEERQIERQLAEAQEIIDRELAEYEASRQQDTRGLQHSETRANASTSHTSKRLSEELQREPSAANDHVNGNAHSPKDQDMKDDLEERPGTEAVSKGDTAEQLQESKIASHETVADKASRDHDVDEHEDVIEEAAEDTVIY